MQLSFSGGGGGGGGEVLLLSLYHNDYDEKCVRPQKL